MQPLHVVMGWTQWTRVMQETTCLLAKARKASFARVMQETTTLASFWTRVMQVISTSYWTEPEAGLRPR